MPRYFHKYNKYNNVLFLREFILKNFHVRLDYENNITTISNFNIVIIENSVVIKKILDFDFSNINKMFSKLNCVMLLA